MAGGAARLIAKQLFSKARSGAVKTGRRRIGHTQPQLYRAVFMLRDIEGLSTSETGEGLGPGEEAVKTRLHRARAMIRAAVTSRIGTAAAGAFQFQAPRCDRVVQFVLEHINARATSGIS